MKTKKRIIHSRYGDERVIVNQGHGVYTVTGKCHYYRAGNNGSGKGIGFFDPDGGPFLPVGIVLEEFDGRCIKDIIIEPSPEGTFKITVETEESEETPKDPWQ